MGVQQQDKRQRMILLVDIEELMSLGEIDHAFG